MTTPSLYAPPTVSDPCLLALFRCYDDTLPLTRWLYFAIVMTPSLCAQQGVSVLRSLVLSRQFYLAVLMIPSLCSRQRVSSPRWLALFCYPDNSLALCA
jgi:hypothetical protein